MKNKKRLTFIVFLIALTLLPGGVLPLSAQSITNPPPQFEHVLNLGSEVALAPVLQDEDGFLWFATASALFKYNGYADDLKMYEPLSGIYTIALDKHYPNLIWITSVGSGLAVFDIQSETWTTYRNDPNDANTLGFDMALFALPDVTDPDIVWVGTITGLDKFRRSTQTFTHYLSAPDHPEGFTSSISGLAQHAGDPHTLWVSTWGGGLCRFDIVGEAFTCYLQDADNTVLALTQDIAEPDVLWVGYAAGRLSRFSKSSATFENYDHDPNDPTSLRAGEIFSIRDDAAGNLWLGSYVPLGLTRFDKTRETFTNYYHDPNDPASLSSDAVMDIYRDNSGILWLVNVSGKVDKYDRLGQNFQVHRSSPDPSTLSGNLGRAIYQDSDGVLWIGTDTGLNKRDPQTGAFTRYLHSDDPKSIASDSVVSITEDREGYLWIGHSWPGMLEKLDRATGRVLERYPTDSEVVHVILPDPTHPDMLWLCVSSPEAKSFMRFDKTTGAYFHPGDSNDPATALQALYTYQVLQDHQQADILWIASDFGLIKFNKQAETFQHYLAAPEDPHAISSNGVPFIYQPLTGDYLWVGTANGGLNRFDKRDETFKVYSKDAGFPANVAGIVPDDAGNLWLGTSQGIAKFNPQTERIERLYDQSDGLPGDVFFPWPNVSTQHALKTDAGELWFLSANGAVSFYPDKLVQNAYLPPVHLTALKQGNVAIPLPAVPQYTEEIRLDWQRNYFEFEFAALNYTQPEKNRYQYLLEGFDKDWYDSETRRFGRYSNLPGGTYTLRVRGSNNEGLWSEQEATLQVVVDTPFWKTGWFYTLCGLVVMGVLGGVYSVRANQLRLRAEKAEVEVAKARVEAENAEIEAAKAHVEAENARMEAELDATRRLQQMLLPTQEELTAIQSLDMAGAMLPAEEVGGDYYDVLHYTPDQLTLAIGDVTGHGLESGLVMLMLQTAVRVLRLHGEDDPRRLINVINHALYDNLQRMQIDKNTTLSLLDYSLGQMLLKVSGQHEHLVIIRKNGQVELLDTLDLGVPLGLIDNIEEFVNEQTVHLQSGDGIVLYSDGITEAADAQENLYGLERLCGVLQQHWAQPAAAIKNAVVADVRAFIGDQTQYDDIALVVLKQR